MIKECVKLAMCQSSNRYEVCHLASKGVQAVHKRGERIQDSINEVMGILRAGAPSVRALRTGGVQDVHPPKNKTADSDVLPAAF